MQYRQGNKCKSSRAEQKQPISRNAAEPPYLMNLKIKFFCIFHSNIYKVLETISSHGKKNLGYSCTAVCKRPDSHRSFAGVH